MADNDSRSGRRYADATLAFIDKLHAVHDAALQRAFDAPANQGMPEIQVSAAEGQVLQLLVHMAGARKAVEVGTLAGYSAIRLARGLQVGGRLWTLESNAHHAEVARANIADAGLADRVEVVLGDGLASLRLLSKEAPFDVVFIDADKERYPQYAHWAAEHLRPGGLLIADNVYFFGRLMSDELGAVAMREFHQQVLSHFDTACVPTPDGMLLGIRRAP